MNTAATSKTRVIQTLGGTPVWATTTYMDRSTQVGVGGSTQKVG